MIPGFLISLVTFPGVIVHELAHQLFCRWFGVAIFEVCYFRLGNPAGYVLSEHARKPIQNILISVGPFLVNTIVGGLIAAPGAVAVITFHKATPLEYFLTWLGVSIAMHAFPSTGDAKAMWESVKLPEVSGFTRALVMPLVGLIYAGAIGSFFWLDLIWGVAVAVFLPTALVRLAA